VKQQIIIKKIINHPSFSILVVLIALLIIFTVFSPGGNFLNTENIKVLLAYGSEFSIIALGVVYE
jgi:ABC-type xylose transport system permease subunit